MKTPVIAIVTAVDPRRKRFHDDLRNSIRKQDGKIVWSIACSDVDYACTLKPDYVFQVDEGSTAAHHRNAAFSFMKKDIHDDSLVFNVDDDDFISPDFFRIAHDAMNDFDSKAMSFLSADYHSPKKTIVWEGQLSSGSYEMGENIVHALTDGTMPLRVVTTAVGMRKHLLDAMNGWDESYSQAEDIDLILRALSSTQEGTFLMSDHVGYFYRKHDHQTLADPDVIARDPEIINDIYHELRRC